MAQISLLLFVRCVRPVSSALLDNRGRDGQRHPATQVSSTCISCMCVFVCCVRAFARYSSRWEDINLLWGLASFTGQELHTASIQLSQTAPTLVAGSHASEIAVAYVPAPEAAFPPCSHRAEKTKSFGSIYCLCKTFIGHLWFEKWMRRDLLLGQ